MGTGALLGLIPRQRPAAAAPADFALVQAGSQAHGSGSVLLDLPNGASTKGTLLVATVVSSAAGTAFTAPAGNGDTGWQLGKAVQCAGGRIEQWFWANNPGGLYPPGAGAVFTGASGVDCRGGIAEFSSSAGSTQILDTVGQSTGTGYGTSMPVRSAAGTVGDVLGVFSQAEFFDTSIGSAGAGWTNPSGYSRLAGIANNVTNTWAWSYDASLTAGYQNPSGGLSYTGPVASAGWAAALCCYRAVRVSPINWCGAEVTNCLDLDPTGQQLIVGGDVEGVFRSPNFGDNWQPCDFGIEGAARQSFAFVAWSHLEPGFVYAGGGHSDGDGAFLVSTDGGATWSKRSTTTIWWYGNGTPSPPRPAGNHPDQDRSVGRMLAQDPAGYLYSATASGGVMRSHDQGVTWTTIWPTPAMPPGTYYPRCITINPANNSELWVGAWAAVGSLGNNLGGVWHTSQARASSPDWNQLGGYDGTVADLTVVGSGSAAYLYAACHTNGIYRAPVSGGPLASLNGTGTRHGGPTMDAIDAGPTASSIWVSLDGYVESGDHQIIAGCSTGVKVSGDANYTNIIRLRLPGGNASGISYTDLTGPNTITIATFPPFDTPWWHAGATWQSWLGGSQNGNPHILVDPNDRQRIYVTGHGGFFRSLDGGNSWQLACNGMTLIAIHTFAIDPNDGSHFVASGSDYTSYDFTDPTGGTGIRDTNPPSSGLESHGVAFDPVDSRVYLAQNKKFGVNGGGGVFYRPATSFAWTATPYDTQVGTAAPMGLYAGRDKNGSRFALAVAQGLGIYRWDGTNWSPTATTDGSAPGVAGGLSARTPTCPFAADRTPGVIYCLDKPTGLYRSQDYGHTWTQIWDKTTGDDRTGWLAASPTSQGELWVATDTPNAGLYKLTNASAGTPGITPIGGVFSAGAGGIAFAPSGALYAIGLGGPPPAPAVTTLYFSNTGGTWTPWCNGDGSDTSYGSPAGQLGISGSGYLWAASGTHVGYWGRVTG